MRSRFLDKESSREQLSSNETIKFWDNDNPDSHAFDEDVNMDSVIMAQAHDGEAIVHVNPFQER